MHNDHEVPSHRNDHDHKDHDVDPPTVPKTPARGGEMEPASPVNRAAEGSAPFDAGDALSPWRRDHAHEKSIGAETASPSEADGRVTAHPDVDHDTTSKAPSVVQPAASLNAPGSAAAPADRLATEDAPTIRDDIARARQREQAKKLALEEAEQKAKDQQQRARQKVLEARKAVKAAESRRHQAEHEAYRRTRQRARCHAVDQLIVHLAKSDSGAMATIGDVLDSLPPSERAALLTEAQRLRARTGGA